MMSNLDLLSHLLLLVPVLISLTVHEWAHARTAYALGDDTAYRLGRMTLNPLDHMDPIGTFLLPLLGVPFGWAKPVPFEPSKFRQGISMDHGAMLVALAGPISNFILAISSAVALIFMPGLPRHEAAQNLLQMLLSVNLMLGTFNLIPVFPLDGSHILRAVIPDSLRSRLSRNPAWSLGGLIVGLLLLAPLMQIWTTKVFGIIAQLRGAG